MRFALRLFPGAAPWIIFIALAACNVQSKIIPTASGTSNAPNKDFIQRETPFTTSTARIPGSVVLGTPGLSVTATAIPSENLTTDEPEVQNLDTHTLPADPDLLSGQEFDFLYLVDGKIMRWDHLAGISLQISKNRPELSADTEVTETCGEAPLYTEFVYDSRRHKIIAVASLGIVANGVELFCLEEVDYPSGDRRLLLSESPRLSNLMLSPDGNWLSYKLSIPSPQIMLANISALPDLRWLVDCSVDERDACSQPVWNNDSRELAWIQDGQVWVADAGLNHTEPRQILSENIPVQNLEGDISIIKVRFAELTWSPDGRYLMAWVYSVKSDVRWLALIDTRLERVVQLPGTYEYTQPAGRSVWKDNNQLVIIRGGSAAHSYQPLFETWSVLPANPEMIVLTDQSVLVSTDFPGLQDLAGLEWEYGYDFLYRVSDRFYTFTVQIPQEDSFPVLFVYDIKFGQLKVVGEIPRDTTLIQWSPDATRAIIRTGRGAILYATLGNDSLADLAPLLGKDSQNFIWVP